MKISWNDTLNTLCGDYIDSLTQKLKSTNRYSDLIRNLIYTFLNYVDNGANYVDNGATENRDFESALRSYAKTHGIDDVSDLFKGELKGLPHFLLGEEWTDVWMSYMDAEALCPYTEGYSRRSVRSARVTLHISNIASALKRFLILRATGFSTIEILHGGRTKKEMKALDSYLPITEWLTAMIKSGDSECIDYLKKAMTSENNHKRLTHDYFRAIVKSGNQELLELEGRLLLAARLQEGLRQAIVETMDEGIPESYIYLLRVIRENNLQRYASVKRGLAVTTGLGETIPPDRITDKYIDVVVLFLEDREAAMRAIGGDDAMEVYLGLWALAFFNTDMVVSPIEDLIANAPSYKVNAAMLMLFVLQNSDLSSRIASEAIRSRHYDHDVMAGALMHYLDSYELHLGWYDDPKPFPPLERFFSSRDEAEADFNILISVLETMKGNERFVPYVFPWLYIELSRGKIADRLAKIALLLDSSQHIDKALDFIGFMEPYSRAGAFSYLMRNPSTEKQVSMAVRGMSDRGEHVRKAACELVGRLHREGRLNDSHYSEMVDLLRLKAADMRVTIISILSSLPEDKAIAIISGLLADKASERRLAALDIIKIWIDNGERRHLADILIPAIGEIKRPTAKEQVLIDSILESTRVSGSMYNSANGFGLYNPNDTIRLEARRPEGFCMEEALTFTDSKRAEDIMLKIMKLIEENADYEFTDTYGETVRMGNSPKVNRYVHSLEALAKPEMWKEFYEREIGSPSDLLRLEIALNGMEGSHAPFFPLLKKLLGKAFHKGDPMASISDRPYYRQAYDVCKCLISEYSSAPDTWRLCAHVLSEIVATVGPDEMVERYRASHALYEKPEDYSILEVWPFRLMCRMLEESALRCEYDLFEYSFRARYAFYSMLGYKASFNPIRPYEYLRLWDAGAIDDKEFWHEMMGREASSSMVKEMTLSLPDAFGRRGWYYKEERQLTPVECDLVNRCVDRILEIELQRGDTPTEVTGLAQKINVVRGIDHFIAILTGLGNEKPRNSFWDNGDSKRDTFSWLLHVSCPAVNDTADDLRSKVALSGISERRLVEAALYSPKWLSLVEKAIGWDGLESAAWYFIVHTGENLTAEEKSYVSRYTTVAPEDFADGAFDPVWFHEVYRQLGKKRFEVVYDAAKYISENNRHTRARKLSDAALGILKAKDVQKEIEEKRNKDLVVAYGLIPLGKNHMNDLRRRYKLLQKFLKESKQYGAQRQASEGRAVALALENLARTAGFGDSTRLTWSMEADLTKETAEFLAPKEIDGLTAYISIGEGVPEIVVESKGKRLQGIPTRLKKDKYIESMRDVCRQLKDQHKRGRSLLESAMVEMSVFTGDEISGLRDNPIIWEMFSRLVLVSDDGSLGFPGADGRSLVSAKGVVCDLRPGDRLRIAHPYDLYMSGEWSDYQSAIYSKKWRQPFKQVFRELYLQLEEEKMQSKSMRYAGNQIMPARTAGVLKKRQWVVDYENGLQKVCFNGNVTAVMYAMADWFSPSDIEAPTLEYVAFYDRRTFKDKKISEVNPVIYSEIMRDVDLAVSVAHAGGVDPETSHSTIEMRRMIVEHAMPMFGITDFKVSGNFVKVRGKLANYNIHLGSGVVHKEGSTQIAVLPVHSQGRGRVFLPFLDEDPKTSEIISKILLFAEDDKIQDPAILSQI